MQSLIIICFALFAATTVNSSIIGSLLGLNKPTPAPPGQTPKVTSYGQEKAGKCPAVKVQENFNISTFVGDWFAHGTSKLIAAEPKWKCAVVQVTQTAPGIYNLKDNNFVWPLGEKFIAEFELRPVEGAPGSFLAKFYHVMIQLNIGLKPVDKILNPTDPEYMHVLVVNEDHALLLLCGDTKNGHKDAAFILSKSRTIQQSTVDQLHDVLHQNGIFDVEPIHVIEQDATTCANYVV